MLLGKRFDHEGEKKSWAVFQTLQGHTFDGLKVLYGLLQQHEGFIHQFCQRWQLDFEHFAECAFITVAFHDVGKAIQPFQRNIREGKRSSAYPHAFYGIAVLAQLCQHSTYQPLLPGIIPEEGFHLQYPFVETLAVAAHHTQLHREIYQSLKRDVQWDREIVDFLNSLLDAHRSYGFDQWFQLRETWTIPFGEISDFPTESLQQFLKVHCQKHNRRYVEGDPQSAIQLKSIYTLLLSLLKLSDITSSIKFEEFASSLDKSPDEAFGPILEEAPDTCLPLYSLEQLLPPGCAPFTYQESVARSGQRVMVLAPCGRGKTEAAMAWAVEQVRRKKAQRIVWALPTQVTSNSMRDRLVKSREDDGMGFPENQVRLYHGRSFSEIKARMAGENNDTTLDIGEVKDENFQGEVFWKPITVTTVDHLIYSFIHGFPQADFALGNLQGGAIIFDEVHYYERLLLSHLKLVFRTLRRMGIPHLMMSGTFPEFLKNEIQQDSERDGLLYDFLVDEEGMDYRPFYITRRSNRLVEKDPDNEFIVSQSFVDELLEHYQQGQVQFVILNTIRRAKAAYQLLKGLVADDNITLLHSQFTYRDRRRKETEVLRRLEDEERDEPYVVVATQVIEVSLNITSGRMYTESAPADALGQRAGRLHRGAKEPSTNDYRHELNIFEAESHLPYVEAEEVVERTWEFLQEGPTSYRTIRDLCEQAYNDFKLGYSDFERKFIDNTLFGAEPREIRFSEDRGRAFQTRDEKYITVDVIPYAVYDQLGKEALSPDHLVSIPYWWLSKSDEENLSLFVREEIDKIRKRYYLLCKVPYDDEIGFHDESLETALEKEVMML